MSEHDNPPDERTNIPISKETRRELRIIKAKEGRASYDDLLRDMVEDRHE